MIDEEEAARLLREANPIPNLDDYEPQIIDRSASPVLLDEVGMQAAGHAGKRRQRLLWAAAAVVVLLGGLAIAFLSQDRDQTTMVVDSVPTTTTKPPTTAKPPTTTTTAAPTTSTTTEASSALSGIPVWPGRGDGQWVPARASVPFAFTAVGNWNSSNVANTEDRFTICAPVDDRPTLSGCPEGTVAIVRLGQGDIEATKAFLASVAGAELTDEEQVVIGGAKGIRFTYTHEVRGTPGGQFQGDIEAPLAIDFGSEKMPIGFGPLGKGLVSIVDVAGETMVVSYQAYDADSGAVTDGFNTNLDEALEIIDSIIWADLQ
jgi:hypothetical protein